jgi:hypothetical protein
MLFSRNYRGICVLISHESSCYTLLILTAFNRRYILFASKSVWARAY